jgi:hypothetical protein
MIYLYRLRLTGECGRNVSDHNSVNATCVSFEKEAFGPNPQSMKEAVSVDDGSLFLSAYRSKDERDSAQRERSGVLRFQEGEVGINTLRTPNEWGNTGGSHLTL